MDGTETERDRALINQDKEPLLSQAIKMVTDDMNSWGLTQEEKITKVKENLELLRGMGDRKQPGGLAQPGGTRKPLSAFNLGAKPEPGLR